MKILDEYENVKIIEKDNFPLPIYSYQPYQFTPEERKILDGSDKILNEAELDAVKREPDIELRKEVLREYIKSKIPETKNKDKLVRAVINKVLGYGQISHLVDDPELEEIMINGVNIPLFVFHRKHGMCQTELIFSSREEITKIITKLCHVHDKELKPMIDFSAVDGNRINVTIEPVTVHGPTMTLRKQKKHFFTITQLIQMGTLDVDTAALLWLAVDGMRLSPANMVICGMVGSGKTSTLNALAMLTPPEERIITIEETRELRLDGKDNWIPLTTSVGVTMEDLVRNTLRMRPDRIIIGEVRGGEAMSFFNAMNVGHKGMCTLHSSSPREVIHRLQSPPMCIPPTIITNLDLIVVQNIFMVNGRPVRRITEVAEVGGREADTVLLGTIYEWDPKMDRAVQSDEMAPIAFLEKLAQKTKVSKKKVVDELARRKNFINKMLEHQILEHNDVLRAVNAFFKEERNTDLTIARELS